MRRYPLSIALVAIYALYFLPLGASAKDAPTVPEPPDKIVVITHYPGEKPPPDTVIITTYPGEKPPGGSEADPQELREPERPKRAIWEILFDWLF